jgi:hypothetical protein
MSFSLYKASVVYPLAHYYGWAAQNFMFFQFDPQIIFWWFGSNKKPIEFLWKDRIERKVTKIKKGSKHEWYAISFIKDALWFLNFKNHINYTISIS